MSGFDRGGRGGGRGSSSGGGRGSDGGGRGRTSNEGGGRGGGRDSGGRGGGRDSGGRGGGGRFDSGGGGRGGRGGPPPALSGRNRHMGEVASIAALVTAPGMGDRDVLVVINPPAASKARDALVRGADTSMPPLADWRLDAPVGHPIDRTRHIVRANHFKVDHTHILGLIAGYHVHIYSLDREGQDKEEVTAKEDVRINTALIKKLRQRHPEWETLTPNNLGFSYDGRSALITSANLHLPLVNANNEPFLTEVIGLPSGSTGFTGEESTRKRYRVNLTQIALHYPPVTDPVQFRDLNADMLRVLDMSLLSFARFLQVNDDPEWFTVGAKLFASRGDQMNLMGAFLARRGYYASLKCCLAGLVFVADISVNVFLRSDPMIEVMRLAAEARSFNDFYNDCTRGLDRRTTDAILLAIKGIKAKLTHLNHTKKVIGLGPAADSSQSAFDMDGRSVTVAQYFEIMARDRTKPQYGLALQNSGGKLKYPKLPTINVGSNSKPILVPPELMFVPGGQARNNVMTPKMTADIIKYAAMRPDDRMRRIIDGESPETNIVKVLNSDDNNHAFGLDTISLEPMAVPAIILPQAKLRYGNGAVVDPLLLGTWNIDRPTRTFARAPPTPGPDGSYLYGVLMVGDRPPPDLKAVLEPFLTSIVNDARLAGVKLVRAGEPKGSPPNHNEMKAQLERFSQLKCRIVIVVMFQDGIYGSIKLVADEMGLVTQCVKWTTITKNARGLGLNIVLKIHSKIGGANHTLIPRGGNVPSADIFQDPPQSISWLFDRPAMLVGIDVSHPEPGSDKESTAAVVGSVDGRLNQYCAHLSIQKSREEMVQQLEDAMVNLFTVFKQRNQGKMPQNVIVYRDGVSDGQFDIVLRNELPQIHGALERMGTPAGNVKVAYVVCQKRHHTRLVYEERNQDGTGTFINPCPGLLLDGRGQQDANITSARYNEFYLNSHAAIQGTAKPCKYSLIHDEIGFRLSELELLTYWTTYLYARCNKSVSYATPAYYAHWASRRCKELAAAGATNDDLLRISAQWARPGIPATMFFV